MCLCLCFYVYVYVWVACVYVYVCVCMHMCGRYAWVGGRASGGGGSCAGRSPDSLFVSHTRTQEFMERVFDRKLKKEREAEDHLYGDAEKVRCAHACEYVCRCWFLCEPVFAFL